MAAARRRLAKKAVLVLALLWRLVPAFGQQGRGQGPIDLILLLDTSASMSGSYREVADYITGPFLKEYLRLGDTFHIIAFSGQARLEIARRIEGRGDLEAVIGRMFLLYPLEPGSDIAGALAYLETYLSQLSPSRPKKIVLISDGEAVPEPSGGIQSLIAETEKRVAGQNAAFEFISVPLGALSSSGRRAPPPDQPAAPLPAPVPPTPPVPVAPRTAPPPVDSPPRLEPPPVPVIPPETPPPSPAPPPSVPPPPPVPVVPQIAPPPISPAVPPAFVPPAPRPQPSFPFILFVVPVFAVPGLAVFFLDRRLRGFPGRAVMRAAARGETGAEPVNAGKPPRSEGQPVMLNLFVEDQNTFIGKRNIHVVKQGINFTIGGGKSDFLIFLVSLPFRIADLRYEAGSCALIPRKSKYFPDTGSSPVKDCIGKTIRVVSDKNYELFMRIDLHEDPLETLNRLMNSVRIPALS